MDTIRPSESARDESEQLVNYSAGESELWGWDGSNVNRVTDEWVVVYGTDDEELS